jgi:hypothetical protein
MKDVWPWVFGIAISLILILFVFSHASNQQAYWMARAVAPRAIEVQRTDELTVVRFPCGMRSGSIKEAKECGFYVWKK